MAAAEVDQRGGSGDAAFVFIERGRAERRRERHEC
jgi:hypothetical protein